MNRYLFFIIFVGMIDGFLLAPEVRPLTIFGQDLRDVMIAVGYQDTCDKIGCCPDHCFTRYELLIKAQVSEDISVVNVPTMSRDGHQIEEVAIRKNSKDLFWEFCIPIAWLLTDKNELRNVDDKSLLLTTSIGYTPIPRKW